MKKKFKKKISKIFFPQNFGKVRTNSGEKEWHSRMWKKKFKKEFSKFFFLSKFFFQIFFPKILVRCEPIRVKKNKTPSVVTVGLGCCAAENNLALFWDCRKRPKSVISGNLPKNAYVWATQWPASSELKIKFDPLLDRPECEFF